MDQQTKVVNRSRAWWFIGVSVILLLLFAINAMVFDGGTNTRTINSNTMGIVLSFIFAAGALGNAIAANASAYLNPSSATATKFISPPLILVVFLLVLPFFITVGITMTE